MATVSKSEVARTRIEPKTKRDGESIRKRLGISQSTLINISYHAGVEVGSIPLSLHIPNPSNQHAFRLV